MTRKSIGQLKSDTKLVADLLTKYDPQNKDFSTRNSYSVVIENKNSNNIIASVRKSSLEYGVGVKIVYSSISLNEAAKILIIDFDFFKNCHIQSIIIDLECALQRQLGFEYEKFRSIENVMLKKTTHYVSDYYYHDIKRLSADYHETEEKHNHNDYVWLVRDSGTNLISFSELINVKEEKTFSNTYYRTEVSNVFDYYKDEAKYYQLSISANDVVISEIKDIDKFINNAKNDAINKYQLNELLNEDYDYNYQK